MSNTSFSDFSPAELHGEMCGAIAADGKLRQEQWAQQWIDEHLPKGNHSALSAHLVALLEDAAQSLASESFDFELKLPEDDLPVVERAQALASWCAGFLSGVGEGLTQAKKLPADIKEVFVDLERIARTNFSEEEAGDDAEADLTELTEYVRVGALLVFEHLRGPDAGERVN